MCSRKVLSEVLLVNLWQRLLLIKQHKAFKWVPEGSSKSNSIKWTSDSGGLLGEHSLYFYCEWNGASAVAIWHIYNNQLAPFCIQIVWKWLPESDQMLKTFSGVWAVPPSLSNVIICRLLSVYFKQCLRAVSNLNRGFLEIGKKVSGSFLCSPLSVDINSLFN